MAEPALLDSTDIAVDYQLLVNRLILLMRESAEPLTLDQLAGSAGLSPFHFARIFRSVAGIPPVEFQTALRFQRAKELLLTTPASVTEICYEIGYGSLGTFSRRFKQLVGVTPAEFRVMPEIVAGMTLDEPVTRHTSPTVSSIARIEGTVIAPGVASRVYIGLFPSSLPASRPVVGQMLTQPGPFLLPDVPPGRYFLMAAALPVDGDSLSQLLPGGTLRVGGGGEVRVVVGNECIQRTVVMRPTTPGDVPLLTALPALVM